MTYIPDNYDAWERYDTEQERRWQEYEKQNEDRWEDEEE